MIALHFSNIKELKKVHLEAVEDYVLNRMRKTNRNDFYQSVIQLPGFETYPSDYAETEGNFDWLAQFLLADFSQLTDWVNLYPHLLKFDYMKRLYLNYFSSGETTYVDSRNSYNSYTLFRMMDLHVCPYCEHEFIEEVTIKDKTRRTMEMDHFYPKGADEYPGLAMCFYNLIPSCKPCNQLKLTNPIAASPYDPSIERKTYLSTNLPLGINMDTVTPEDCKLNFNAVGEMALNVETLALDQRYENVTPEVYRLLKNNQLYNDDKIHELERLGLGTYEDLKFSLFGNPRKIAKGKELHTKMKEDLIGY